MSLKTITLNRECNQGNAILDENIPVEVSSTPTIVTYDMNGVGFKAGDQSSVSINHSGVDVYSGINEDNKIDIVFVSNNGNSYSLLNEQLDIEIITEE